MAWVGEINYNFVNIYVPTNPSERKRFSKLLLIISFWIVLKS